jgi:hypothetical protein
MKKIIHLFHILVLALGIASCEQGSGSSSKKKEKPSREGSDNGSDTDIQNTCKSSDIISVLGRGRSILSRSLLQNNSYQVWSTGRNRIIGNINYIKNFHSISNNAVFYLREISSKYFQIQAVKKNARYIEGLRFSGITSIVEFSENSEFIISVYKPRNSLSNRLNIFDLRAREIIYARNLNNIKLIKMVNEENLLVLTKDRNGYNQLFLTNPLLQKERIIRLPMGKVHSITQLKNTVLVNIGRKLEVYNLRTLKREFSYFKKILFTSDYGSNLILVSSSDRDEMSLIDIRRSETIMRFKVPSKILASSCKINHMSKELICKSAIDPNKIIRYDYLKGRVKEICL